MSLKTTSVSGVQELELVTFALEDQEFGVNIMDVQEVVRIPEITRIPRSPFYVSGIANLRGNVLPVINTRQRFSMHTAENTETTRVVVVNIEGRNVGIIVDAVSEVMRVNENSIDPPPEITAGGVDGTFLDGVVKLDDGARLVMALNPTEVCAIELEDLTETKTDSPSKAKEEARIQQEELEHEEEQLVTFALTGEEYGVGIRSVREIIRVPEVIHVPNAPVYVEGLIALRDQLVPLINLRKLFGELSFEEEHTEGEGSDEQRVVVCDSMGMTIGLIVDKVNEVMRIPTKLVDEPPSIHASKESQVKGIAKLDEGKRLIMILDTNNLVDASTLGDLKGVEKGGENSEEGDIDDDALEDVQLVTFRIEDEEFGIRIMQIQEINRLEEVTKVPRTSSFVSGVTNLRGTVVPVIDLRARFGMETREPDDRTRVVIIDLEGKRTGLIVDQVHEVLRLLKADIEPAPNVVSSDTSNDFIEGVGKLDNGKRMLVLLNVEKILMSTEAPQVKEADAPAKAKADAPAKAKTDAPAKAKADAPAKAKAPAKAPAKKKKPKTKKRKSLKKADE